MDLITSVRNIPLRENNNTSSNICIIQSKLQLDPVLVYRLRNGISDMIVSSDSDFSMYLEKDGVQVTDMKYNHRTRTFSNFKLASASIKPMLHVVEALQISLDRIKKPKYPVFEGLDINGRVLASIIIGCDANPGGLKGHGPAAVWKLVATDSKDDNTLDMNYDINNNLRQFIYSKGKLKPEVVDAYLMAMIYEPANYAVDFDVDESNNVHTDSIYNIDADNVYMFGEPTQLYKYVEDFAPKNSPEVVVDGPVLSVCVGPYGCKDGNGSHCFITDEGSHVCHSCCGILCRFCNMEMDDVHYCTKCYLDNIVGVDDDIDDSVKGLSIQSMRKELENANYDLGNAGTVAEIEELYDTYITKKSLNVFEDVENNIKFPLYKGGVLNDKSILVDILGFDFSDGGSFIKSEELSLTDVVSVLDLLAEFVRYDKERTDIKSHLRKLYSSMPKIIVNTAEGSRKDSGKRMILRAIRGALDPRTKSLYFAEVAKVRKKQNEEPVLRMCRFYWVLLS